MRVGRRVAPRTGRHDHRKHFAALDADDALKSMVLREEGKRRVDLSAFAATPGCLKFPNAPWHVRTLTVFRVTAVPVRRAVEVDDRVSSACGARACTCTHGDNSSPSSTRDLGHPLHRVAAAVAEIGVLSVLEHRIIFLLTQTRGFAVASSLSLAIHTTLRGTTNPSANLSLVP